MPETEAERLEAATADARQVLHLIHEATRDMRQAIKEAKAVRDDALDSVGVTVKNEVIEQVQRLGESTDRAIQDATSGVFARFDKLGDLLLNGKDGVHLERLVANWRERAERAREDDRQPVPEFWRRR